MKTLISILFILALAVSANFLPQDEQPYRTYDLSVHGQKFHFEFFAKDADGTPEWQLGQGEPPISPNDAYLRAKEALRTLLPESGNTQAYRLTIDRITGSGGRPHAYYDIGFLSADLDAEPKGGLSEIPTIHFLVLMDGRVIVPHPLNKEGGRER